MDPTTMSLYEAIVQTLAFLDDITFAPFNEKGEWDKIFNPSLDGRKSRILRPERTIDWRQRVFRSISCHPKDRPVCCDLFLPYRKYSGLDCCPGELAGRVPYPGTHYLTKMQCRAWLRLYYDGVDPWQRAEKERLARVIEIIAGNFDTWKAWVGEDG